MSADPNDRDPLLDRLAAMWSQHDPIPAELDAEVLALIDAQAVVDDVLVLELVSDQDRLAGVRGAEERILRFAAPDDAAELVLRLVPDGEGTRIDGWLVPASRGTVTLSIRDRAHQTAVDAAGRFAFAAVPDGEAVLRWSAADASPTASGSAAGWATPAFTIRS
jgi:hypothetical protein